jgi:hypothetical protein
MSWHAYRVISSPDTYTRGGAATVRSSLSLSSGAAAAPEDSAGDDEEYHRGCPTKVLAALLAIPGSEAPML